MTQYVSEQDYRDRVLEGLQDLRTKMNRLVGEEGTNGAFGYLEDRVKSLEDTRTGGRAVGWVLGILWAVILAAIAWFRGR